MTRRKNTFFKTMNRCFGSNQPRLPGPQDTLALVQPALSSGQIPFIETVTYLLAVEEPAQPRHAHAIEALIDAIATIDPIAASAAFDNAGTFSLIAGKGQSPVFARGNALFTRLVNGLPKNISGAQLATISALRTPVEIANQALVSRDPNHVTAVIRMCSQYSKDRDERRDLLCSLGKTLLEIDPAAGFAQLLVHSLPSDAFVPPSRRSAIPRGTQIAPEALDLEKDVAPMLSERLHTLPAASVPTVAGILFSAAAKVDCGVDVSQPDKGFPQLMALVQRAIELLDQAFPGDKQHLSNFWSGSGGSEALRQSLFPGAAPRQTPSRPGQRQRSKARPQRIPE